MPSTDQILPRLVRTLSSYFRIGTFRLKDSSGVVQLRNAGDTAFADGAVNKLRVQGNNAANAVILTSPGALGSNVTFTLPGADGSTGQVIKTDGAGTLSFVSVNAIGINIQEESFTEATSSPVTIFSADANTIVLEVTVVISVAAGGGSPTVEVGITGTTNLFMTTAETDLLTVGTYTVYPETSVGVSTVNVLLSIVPSAQTFTGKVFVKYGIPG
jgi:hypothetical protein